MGSSQKKCRKCNIRGDKKHLYKVQSQTLISKLNDIYPNDPISQGMYLCNTCRQKAYYTINSTFETNTQVNNEEDINNNIVNVDFIDYNNNEPTYSDDIGKNICI